MCSDSLPDVLPAALCLLAFSPFATAFAYTLYLTIYIVETYGSYMFFTTFSFIVPFNSASLQSLLLIG